MTENIKIPKGATLISTLIDLLAEQEGVTIEYILTNPQDAGNGAGCRQATN